MNFHFRQVPKLSIGFKIKSDTFPPARVLINPVSDMSKCLYTM